MNLSAYLEVHILCFSSISPSRCSLKIKRKRCNAILKIVFIINRVLFYFAHDFVGGLTNVLLFPALGGPTFFFAPVTIVRAERELRGRFAPQSVVSVEDGASPCRGKRERKREEGGQVSAQCSSFKILS